MGRGMHIDERCEVSIECHQNSVFGSRSRKHCPVARVIPEVAGIDDIVIFLGGWELDLAFDPSWWRRLRAGDSSDYRWGVLWLVDSTNPANEPPSNPMLATGMECAWVGVPLRNPAKVPVRLVDPEANECATAVRSGSP